MNAPDFPLFDNDAVGVAVVRNGVVLHANAKLERLHGVGGGGLNGRRLDLFDGERVRECEVARDDGGRAWLRASPQQERGVDSVWLVEDVTEIAKARHSARRSRRRAAEMALQLKQAAIRLHEELAAMAVPRPQRDLRLEDRLRRAVERRSFQLHYQPIVDMGGLRIASLEALLRWRDDDGNWVPPSQFVPLAEASGLIAPLGEWALQQACRQSVAWRRDGLAVPPIAVNLSPCQLMQPDLVERILGMLWEEGVDPGALELELTETSVMRDIDHTLPKLQKLASSGVRLAIDDFGTGYSSLAYLRRLPISKLKIDQSFVRGLHQDRNDSIIVSAVVDLAKNLGLATVAEGVETQEQLDALRALGCDALQGYFFCRPVAAEAISQLLREQQAHASACTDFTVLDLPIPPAATPHFHPTYQ